MKKGISILLVFALLVATLPCNAIANSLYEKHFYIMPTEGVDETPYRLWAAYLLFYYRNLYAALSSNEQFRKSDYTFYKRSTFGWNTETIAYDKAIYHPYYTMSEKKEKFNRSKDANSQRNGKTYDSTQYTLLNNEELTGLYMWIIKESILEKQKIDPDYFTREIEGNERTYTFKVSEGKMEPDKLMEAVDQKGLSDAQNATVQFATDALKTAVKTALAVHNLNGQGADLIRKAQEEAQNKGGIGTDFWKALMDELINSVTDFVASSLSEVSQQCHDNFQASMDNYMEAQVTIELLDSLEDCNEHVIDYLRITYLENTPIVYEEKFVDTVEQFVSVLESPGFAAALQKHAKDEEVVSETMKAFDLSQTKVMSQEDIKKMIIRVVAGNLIEELNDIIGVMIKEGIKTLFGKSDKKSTDAVEEFIARITDEAKKRANAALEDIETGKSNDFSTAFRSRFISDEEGNYFMYIATALVDIVIEGALGKILTVDDQKNGTEELEKSLQTIKDELKDQGENVSVAGVITIMVIRALLSTFQESVKINELRKTVTGLEVTTVDSLDSAMKQLKESMNTLENEIYNGEIKPATYAVFLENGIEFVVCLGALPQNTRDALWQNVVENLKITNLIGNVVKEIAENDNIRTMLMNALFGGSVKGTQEIIAGQSALDENIKDDAFTTFLSNFSNSLMDTTTGTVEGVWSVVDDLWDTMMKTSESLAIAYSSVTSHTEGEHLASLNAERGNQTYLQSKRLEMSIISGTYGENENLRLRGYKNNRDVFLINLSTIEISASDIVYQDEKGQYVLAPDIDEIEELTSNILLQMHLDAVGMGTYITAVTNRDDYRDSDLYKKYFNEGVLLEEGEAQRRYNTICYQIRHFEEIKPAVPSAQNGGEQ